ncbi:MAG: glyoxalase/bleomycin resistance/extradiol dioxygenase family protein [Rhizobiales bacterium]|nr:glyoxalase/bleomycin resistance/extradiol dioxygenase family protein [Hyphomicrobiales bacterium]
MTAPKMTFINLPVASLDKAIGFYKALGFDFNPAFTDETATCMIINDNTFAMLLTYAKFDSFIAKPRADAKAATGGIYALALESKSAVDAMMNAAVQAGGGEYRPTIDLGFMYNRAFADPDGHVWEPFWMDPAAMPSN